MPPHRNSPSYLRIATRLHTSASQLAFIPPHRNSPSCLRIATRLHASVPPRRYTYSTPPDLRTSISLRLQRASGDSKLHLYPYTSTRLASSAPYLHTTRLHACIAPRELHTSMPPRPQVHNAPLELHASTSLQPQRASRPPGLDASTSLHLKRASRAPYLDASTSLHPQSSMPSCIHAYRALQRSIPSNLHVSHA